MRLFEIGGGGVRHFRIHHDVEVGFAEPREIGGRRIHRRDHMDVDAERIQQPRDLGDVVAVAEAERGRAQQIAARTLALRAFAARPGKGAHQTVEGLRGAPVFLLLIGRQFERHDGNRQRERGREPAGIVLDELGRAGGADDHRLRLKAPIGLRAGGLEQFGGVAAEVARLEGGVGDGRAPVAPLDHREQQICVGVALRRVQDIMQPLHRGGDAHGADMRRPFVGPERELHATPPAVRDARAGARRVRRGRRPARSPGSA